MEFPSTLPTLKSGSITLSPLTVSDTEQLFHLVMKNRMHLRTWLNWVDETNAIEHTAKFVQNAIHQHQEQTGIYYIIWAENAMLGSISYNWIDKRNKKANLGYWIDEESQGKGYTSSACTLLIDYGFKTLGLHRVEIAVAKENTASSAIPLKLGFQKEAVLREAEWLNDHFTDQDLYATLSQDWERR